VQSPTFSQSYNRYAYVFNNPLAFTDPSGFRAYGPGDRVYVYTGGEKGGGQNGEKSDQIHCDEIAPRASCFEFDVYREFRDQVQKPVNELIRSLTTTEAVEASIWVASIGSGLFESVQVVIDDPVQYLPNLPQGVVDATTGFGDGAFTVLTIGFGDLQSVRDFLNVDGGVNRHSTTYQGFEIAGGILGGGTLGGAGLRVLSNFTGTARSGLLHRINHNQHLRVGPGRMPANGALPAGPKVPRVSIGPQRQGVNNPHIDLRIRPFD